MSEQTLDEAIKHCLEVAEQNEAQAEKIGRQLIGSAINKYATDCQELAAENRQLAEWLTELKDLRAEQNEQYTFIRELMDELKEAKRLLKMAVEDLNATVAEVYNGGVICKCCKWESQLGECCCPGNGGCDVDYRWRYADEALKLIGDEPNEV